MAIRGNPQSITDKWASRTSGATAEVIAGVDRVTEAPGAKAARQDHVWAQNTVAAREKWKNRVGSVPLEEWKQSAKEGASRIAAGVQAKKPKAQKFWEEFIPHLEATQRAVQAMPRGTLDQNLTRMVENARRIAAFRRSGR